MTSTEKLHHLGHLIHLLLHVHLHCINLLLDDTDDANAIVINLKTINLPGVDYRCRS